MAKTKADELIEKIGRLQEKLQRLEEQDYVTAQYKGYSSEGLTLTEVVEAMDDVERRLEYFRRKLDDINP